MTFKKSYVPYGGYWSSPYAKWQGSLANLHALQLAATTAKKFFELRGIDQTRLESLYLGLRGVYGTGRPSPSSLYTKDLSSMDIEGGLDQKDSEGFIKINAIRLMAHHAICQVNEPEAGQ